VTTHQVRVLIDDEERLLTVPHGANLRRALLEAGISPYAPLPRRVNCGGRGLCATCGVWVEAGEPAPLHWHDRAAAAFGYPRLSCQMRVDADMTVRILTEKVIWGARDPQRRYRRS
jgi:ferredoxin